MSNDTRKRGLGKGLSALLGEEGADFAELDRLRAPKTVPIDLLYPGQFQPRRTMTEEGLEELSRSVAEKGILQPILVRRHPEDPNTYEIIAGERRWRAAQMAQLHDVPVVIKDLSDREALEIALVENLQRQDLSPLEEAEGYRRLMEDFRHNQEDLARSVGKSRSHVANTMRLLALPDPVKTMLDAGQLSAGHARALLMARDPAAAAARVVKRGLNVRQTEHLVRAETAPPRPARTPEKDPDTLALERDLGNLLGLDVEIKLRRSGGSLVLHYRSLEQLDDILHRLSHARDEDSTGGGTGANGDAGDPSDPWPNALADFPFDEGDEGPRAEAAEDTMPQADAGAALDSQEEDEDDADKDDEDEDDEDEDAAADAEPGTGRRDLPQHPDPTPER